MSEKSAKPAAANTSGSGELSDNDLQAVAGGIGHIGIGPVPIPIGPPIAIDPIDIFPLPIGPLPVDTK